jgi:hypothetical protein
MGYSPLGSSFDRHPEAHGTTLLKNPIVNEIAAVRKKLAVDPSFTPSCLTMLMPHAQPCFLLCVSIQ